MLQHTCMMFLRPSIRQLCATWFDWVSEWQVKCHKVFKTFKRASFIKKTIFQFWVSPTGLDHYLASYSICLIDCCSETRLITFLGPPTIIYQIQKFTVAYLRILIVNISKFSTDFLRQLNLITYCYWTCRLKSTNSCVNCDKRMWYIKKHSHLWNRSTRIH